MRDATTQPVIIAGAGPGGLTLALALQQRGLPVRVFESVRELRPLGVGINVLPHAARVLHGLGLADRLADLAIPTAELRYYSRRGQLIWAEPRGVAAGYAYPQYSVHRGELQLMLLAEARARLGSECIATGHALVSWRNHADRIVASFQRREGGLVEVEGRCLVAADGIHSTARRHLYPNEGAPIYSGRILWRAVSEAPPFLDGRTMIMAGHQTQKFVAYSISPAHERRGQALVNWVAELEVPNWAPPPPDWNRQVAPDRFRGRFASWRFDWLDVPALIDRAAVIFEYPMVDRDPLPGWRHGRTTLLGDAAHPMYPIGSNGASQAILDADCLAEQLAAGGMIEKALERYEVIRRPATAQLVAMNRANGPEQVMQLAEERAPDGFADIHDVISRQELEEIAARYKQVAGFSLQDVNRGGGGAAG